MKHTILLLLFIAIISLNAHAQKLLFAFGHAEYASPVGKLRDANNGGLGLEAGAGLGRNKTFFVGTIGIHWLKVNRNGLSSEGGLKVTPVTLGLRRYVLLKNLFVKADAGVAGVKIIDTDNKNTQFTSSFGAGIKFTRFEAIVDYNSVSSYGSWIGIKLGTLLSF